MVPLAMLDGVAVRLTVGAGITVTDALSLAVPPEPVQVSVKVALEDILPLLAVPLVAFVPDQLPDAVHEFALALLQESWLAEPLATLDGLAVRLTVGAGMIVTDLLSLAVPPLPVQVKLNVALANRFALVAVPLVAFAPDQPPEAVHELALLLVQDSCVLLPSATLLGLAWSDTVGGAVGSTSVVAVAAIDCADSLRFGLMRSNAVTVYA